uniref:Uncharacterized protein n=1 Tax=Oryza meridionalis TaxID=40149 RepID=A0A0E0D0M0_9ORYZ
MADSCCAYMHEMDVVHRWLPSEVLRDIGITDADEQRRLAAVEDLAERLAGVLGGGEMAAAAAAQHPPSYCHHPQVRGGATLRDHHALAGLGPRPPPYLLPAAPAAPWQVMTGGQTNTMVLQPRLAPAASRSNPHPLLRCRTLAGAAPPATTRRSNGTGFFLPRTVAADPCGHANHHTAPAARPPTNVPPRHCCAYMHEMDDAHRWLPSEVLRDIGIADADERRRLAIVEDLAVRLADVLGGGEMAAQAQRPPSSSHHHPQVKGGDGVATLRDHHALIGASHPIVATNTPPPYMPLPAPATPWQVQVMMGGPRNTMVLQPRMAPAANNPHLPLPRGGAVDGAAPPATTRRSSGTSFFLPRTAAADPRHTTMVARPLTNVPPRKCRAQRHRRGNEAAAPAAMARRQQELTRAIAGNMEQMQQLAGAPVATTSPYPELAMPQEWTY